MRHVDRQPRKPLKYQVEISPVREVSLLGTADLGFWQDKLDREGLVADSPDGQAHLMIVAAEMKYMGIRFRELSISVLVAAPKSEHGHDAVFLVSAFNSCGAFAVAERLLFRTPYYRGRVVLDVKDGWGGFEVRLGDDGSLNAWMGVATLAERVSQVEPRHTWEGPIYLPNLRRPGAAGTRLFFGKLAGEARICEFSPSDDLLSIVPSRDYPVFQWLLESQFAGRQWQLRSSGAHSKSKTLRRAAVALEPSNV